MTLDPWNAVLLARHPQRPHAKDWVDRLCGSRFLPLGGDRAYRRDPAILAGIGWLGELPVMLLGHQKGHDFAERERHNFGMAHPEGYRGARRLIGVAERFRLPVVTLVDTPGAYPGLGAEQRGQSEAIAGSLERLFTATVPIVTVVLGEGGSGGALALGVSDVTLMLERAVYSVISPEGCASILWGDSEQAPAAAAALRLTAGDLFEFGIVDEIIPEPAGDPAAGLPALVQVLRAALLGHLRALVAIPPEVLLRRRARRYERIGRFRRAGAVRGRARGDAAPATPREAVPLSAAAGDP